MRHCDLDKRLFSILTTALQVLDQRRQTILCSQRKALSLGCELLSERGNGECLPLADTIVAARNVLLY